MSNILRFTLILATVFTANTGFAQTMQRSTASSSQSSFNSNVDGTVTFQFENTPFANVLETFGVGATVLFDSTMPDLLDSKITYSGKDASIDTALTSLFDKAKIRVVKTESQTVITATKPTEEIVLPVRSMGRIRIDRNLIQPIRINMRHTPLDMVVRFASGMSRLDIQIDRVALQRAGINHRIPVSIESESKPLGQALRQMLKPHGLALEVVGDIVVVTIPMQSSPRSPQR